jgi:hypothetical protein
MDRNRLIGMIHLAKKRMGWDEDTYRAWLEKSTGRASCKACSERELSLAADLLRDMKALDPPPQVAIPGGSGPDRPTQAQWRLVINLAKKCGLSGALDDPGLATLCARSAKIDNPRFLDRHGIQALILALEGWAKSKAARKSGSDRKKRNPGD